MFRLSSLLLRAGLIALLLTGCFRGSKASGKFSNQDKPKPVENSGK